MLKTLIFASGACFGTAVTMIYAVKHIGARMAYLMEHQKEIESTSPDLVKSNMVVIAKIVYIGKNELGFMTSSMIFAACACCLLLVCYYIQETKEKHVTASEAEICPSQQDLDRFKVVEQRPNGLLLPTRRIFDPTKRLILSSC